MDSESQAQDATLPSAGGSRPPRLPLSPPGALPFLGHAPAFFSNPVKLGLKGLDAGGEIFSLKVPFGRIVVLTGPEAHRFFFSARDSDLSMSDFSSFALKIFFGPSFEYDATHDFPFSQVRWFAPLLVESRMRSYPAILATTADAFLDALPDEAELDLVSFCKEFLLRLTSRCLLGPDWGEADLQSFNRFFLRIDGALGFRSIVAARLGVPFLMATESLRKEMQALVERMLGDADPAPSGDNLFSVLSKREHPQGRPMSPAEITGLSVQFLFAAHTPASVALAWTLLELERTPEWRERLLAELAPAGMRDSAFRWEGVGALDSLEWTLLESLRLHPPTTFHGRVAKRDLVYKGFTIPARSTVLVVPKLGHGLREFFPEPARFDPLRFSPERREFARANHVLVNFGGGQHHCVGRAFALMQLKSALAALFARFEVQVLDPDVKPRYFGMVTLPGAPCRVRLTRRR